MGSAPDMGQTRQFNLLRAGQVLFPASLHKPGYKLFDVGLWGRAPL